jgi:hypothetical protein
MEQAATVLEDTTFDGVEERRKVLKFKLKWNM